jgi:hypothetical protein
MPYVHDGLLGLKWPPGSKLLGVDTGRKAA